MSNTKIKILGIPVYEKRQGEAEQRSDAVLSNLENPKKWLTELIGGGETFSGAKVNENTALTFSAYYACVRIISNSVAMPPFGIFRKDNEGNRFSFSKHPNQLLISKEPNPIMGSFTWRQVMTAHALTKGNGYSIIHRNGAYRPVELELIQNPDDVEPFLYERRLFYKVKGIDTPFPADDIFHIKGLGFDGIKGKSVLSVARESIGSALAMQEYGGKVFKSGGSKRIALTHPKKLDTNAQDSIRKSWSDTYSGLDKSQKIAILDLGLDVKEIGMNPEDAQFIAARQFSVNDMARFFGLIMDLLATDKNPTYGSSEQRAIDYVKYTMMPWYRTWEDEADRKLFRGDEKLSTYTKFNIDALLRGDQASQAQYFKDMFYIGALNRNEIRALKERNKIKDGDKYYLQTNMAPAEDIGNIAKEKTSRNQLGDNVQSLK